MTRRMVDATGDNAALVLAMPDVDLIGAYITGLEGVPWSLANLALIPKGKLVAIDQASGNAPNYSATVQDVEPLCYTAAQVPGWQAQCTAWRPTVYCDQNDFMDVLATGWRGDVWLAIPGWQIGDVLPNLMGCNLVAVQNNTTDNRFDVSIVLDDTWPNQSKAGDDDVRIIVVDRATVPAGIPWPGDFILTGNGTIEHIETQERFTALVHANVPSATVSYADFLALRDV